MARNLLSVALSIGRAAAADKRRAQNAAIRQHNANIRYQNAIARENQRDVLLQEKENAIQYAHTRTNEAENIRSELLSITKDAETKPITFAWSSLKLNETFNKAKPEKPPETQEPKELSKNDFKKKISILDIFIKSRRQANEIIQNKLFEEAIEKNRALINETKNKNMKNHEFFENEFKKWEEESNDFYKNQEDFNGEIDNCEKNIKIGERNSIELYFDTVIEKIKLPKHILSQWKLQYEEDSKILIIDYELPEKEIIPTLNKMKYISSRKEFSETHIKDKDVGDIYDEMLLQISLRVTNDIYTSDIHNKINSLVFNGIFNGVNKSTGKNETKCILSLQTIKASFSNISIKNVDAKSCFIRLKGVASNKLSELIPVAPILSMNREDTRFIEGIDVANTIRGKNLAAMDWESFEHLIRELFEKEFAINGAEVRITQSSRDRGVDAVMFDPDPIRGGKYIIQAKRYTNVVGVSAVRDLYGTLMNEGAVKGILVTTANYGADSYEFAKNKPIALINGSNLLHMLQKHGYQARIDIDEAKKLLSEDDL